MGTNGEEFFKMAVHSLAGGCSSSVSISVHEWFPSSASRIKVDQERRQEAEDRGQIKMNQGVGWMASGCKPAFVPSGLASGTIEGPGLPAAHPCGAGNRGAWAWEQAGCLISLTNLISLISFFCPIGRVGDGGAGPGAPARRSPLHCKGLAPARTFRNRSLGTKLLRMAGSRLPIYLDIPSECRLILFQPGVL